MLAAPVEMTEKSEATATLHSEKGGRRKSRSLGCARDDMVMRLREGTG